MAVGEVFDYEAWLDALPRLSIGGAPGAGGVEKILFPPRTPGAPATPNQPSLPARLPSREVQQFAPASSAFALEPNGWAIVGGHMNAYTEATTVTRSAAILSVPVTVTFTPVEYRWDWGDGETLTTTFGGESWAALGLADWSQTATSHVYTQKGQRTVSLQVAYSATVQAGGRTIPVEGLVVGAAHTAPVLVVESQRALVAHNCSEAPNDPGCR